jgi:hypothetical protein
MEFIVKKTTELTNAEQVMINDLFNTVFERDRTVEQFRDSFLNTPFGYSFHSMMIDNGKITGCLSYKPYYYMINEKRHLFLLGVDTMISKPYRDFFNYQDMSATSTNYWKTTDVEMIFGFPNDNAYPVVIKAKMGKLIGRLYTYCLPYRIGGIKPNLKVFNWLSIFLSRTWVFFVSCCANKKVYHFSIVKEAASFNPVRYRGNNNAYKIINHKGNEFVYKITEHEGVRAAFLIDIFEKSPRNFCNAVKYIVRNHSREFDILLYIGRLPFKVHGLMRLPKKLSPKNFYFTYKIIKKDLVNEDDISNINNWDVNLSNYDLV